MSGEARRAAPETRGAEVHVVYADGRDPATPGLCHGEAGHVWVDASGDLQTDTRVALSPNTTHALLGHRVVAELNRLDLDGTLGGGLDVLVRPPRLDAVADVLYEADRTTYGALYEFVVSRDQGHPGLEVRLRIDNREYQRSLARLQFLITTASREGRAVRLRIGAWLAAVNPAPHSG
jgi:hypothetical protein